MRFTKWLGHEALGFLEAMAEPLDLYRRAVVALERNNELMERIEAKRAEEASQGEVRSAAVTLLWLVLAVTGVLFLLLVVACGGEPSAPERCADLVAAYCARVQVCTSVPVGVCEHDREAAFDCSRAVDVRPSFAACLSALPAASCTVSYTEAGGVSLAVPECDAAIGFAP